MNASQGKPMTEKTETKRVTLDLEKMQADKDDQRTCSRCMLQFDTCGGRKRKSPTFCGVRGYWVLVPKATP